MIRRITLENFMSHARTVIDLADGLTVLAGPNNCGKSAVVEALRTLCTNCPSEALVRHGERESRVTVETGEGHVLVWQRKGTVVSYSINGRDVHRLGRYGVPDDLHELLRLPDVQPPQGEPVAIHFGMQKFPLFLIDDRAGAQTAGFFSASNDSEKLMQMQRLHKDKVRNARALHKVRTAELERTATLLETLAPLEGIPSAVEKLEADYAAALRSSSAAGEIERAISALKAQLVRHGEYEQRVDALKVLRAPPAQEDAPAAEALLAKLKSTRSAVERGTSACAMLASIKPAPAMQETTAIEALAQGLARAANEFAYRTHQATAMERLNHPPELEDERELARLAGGMAKAAQDRSRMAAQQSSFSVLSPPPIIDDVELLARSVEALILASRQHRIGSARRAAVASLREPQAPAETAALADLIDRWAGNRALAAQYALDMYDADKRIAQLREEIRQWAALNPTCPICGGMTDVQRLVTEEHVHG